MEAIRMANRKTTKAEARVQQNIRLPARLKCSLVQLAGQEQAATGRDISVNSILVDIIEDGIEQRLKGKGKSK